MRTPKKQPALWRLTPDQRSFLARALENEALVSGERATARAVARVLDLEVRIL